MASTVPAKSNNPLHNFDLPFNLKWKNNHHHHHSSSTTPNHHPQRRRSVKLSTDSSSPSRSHESLSAARHSPSMHDSARHSPMRDPPPGFRPSPIRDSVASARRSPMPDPAPGFRRSPVRDPVAAARQSPTRYESDNKARHSRVSAAAAPESKNHKVQEKKHKVQDADAGNRSKILIKIPRKNNKSEEIPEDQQQQKKTTTTTTTTTTTEESTQQVVDEEPKIWNLRPRKPIHKSLNLNNNNGGGGGGSGTLKSGGSSIQETNKSQLPNVNKPLDQVNSEANKKEKRMRLSISLSREEVDEDIYAMTGLKAARRPKKRAKVVQKQLDTLFPGLWLASITPDSYKVCENLPKG